MAALLAYVGTYHVCLCCTALQGWPGACKLYVCQGNDAGREEHPLTWLECSCLVCRLHWLGAAAWVPSNLNVLRLPSSTA